MFCQACNNGDHHLCGMQTWCECDCEGFEPYIPAVHHVRDDLDAGRQTGDVEKFVKCTLCLGNALKCKC